MSASPPRIDPITQQPFNVLAYVPVLVLVLSGAGAYAASVSKTTALQHEIITVAARLSVLEDRGEDREDRIRVLEQAVGRMEERLDYIGQGITDIREAVVPHER